MVWFSVTALLVGEKLPPEAELDVSDIFPRSRIWINQIMFLPFVSLLLNK